MMLLMLRTPSTMRRCSLLVSSCVAAARRTRPPFSAAAAAAIIRRSSFSTDACCSHLRAVTEQDVQAFGSMLKDDSTSQTKTTPYVSTVAEHPEFRQDWTGHYRASPQTPVLQPADTRQVSEILKYCHQHQIGVVPVAGNTGLVGGSMPTTLIKTTTSKFCSRCAA